MRTSVLLLATAATIASAAPTSSSDEISVMKREYIQRLAARSRLAKRQSVTSEVGDAAILNFALTLEHLEAAFYGQALTKFNESAFEAAGYKGAYSLIEQISADESQHVSFLTSALTAAGATPVQPCTYNFPYTTVGGFLGLSQVLEGVGTSAYLGAAGGVNASAYVTAAASILTVEARHAAFVRFLNGYSPFPAPEDTPASAAAVVTLATPFFVSCPTGSAPAIAGHPALNLTTAAPAIGSPISIAPVNASAVNTNGTVYCGFASGLSAGYSVWANGSCVVPTSNVTDGQTYVFLSSQFSVADDAVLAGPAIIELGAHNFSVQLSGGAASAVSATSTGTAGASTVTKSGAAAVKVAGALAFFGGAITLLL